jgi:hypothetical protein
MDSRRQCAADMREVTVGKKKLMQRSDHVKSPCKIKMCAIGIEFALLEWRSEPVTSSDLRVSSMDGTTKSI